MIYIIYFLETIDFIQKGKRIQGCTQTIPYTEVDNSFSCFFIIIILKKKKPIIIHLNLTQNY